MKHIDCGELVLRISFGLPECQGFVIKEQAMNGISSTASRSSLQSLPDAPQPQPTGADSPQPAPSPSTRSQWRSFSD
nr:hypothetical protein [uncultured Ottowia sp.]